MDLDIEKKAIKKINKKKFNKLSFKIEINKNFFRLNKDKVKYDMDLLRLAQNDKNFKLKNQFFKKIKIYLINIIYYICNIRL